MVHLKFGDLNGDLGKACKKKEKYWHNEIEHTEGVSWLTATLMGLVWRTAETNS